MCDICKKDETLGVYASRYGPISLAYCKECLQNGAEDISIAAYIYEINPEMAESITIYHDGSYKKFDRSMLENT